MKWTEEEKEYLKEITPGRHHKEILALMNEKFNRPFRMGQIKGAIARYKLNTGFTGRFEKGNIPFNKGKKGECPKGCEKTWFKKGQTPINHKPVGSERIDLDGYTLIKVAEPNKWQLKHRVIYEKAYGPIPPNMAVIFLDKNKRNFNINNLALVSREELAIINKNNFIKENAALSRAGVNVAKVKNKINKLKKKSEE